MWPISFQPSSLLTRLTGGVLEGVAALGNLDAAAIACLVAAHNPCRCRPNSLASCGLAHLPMSGLNLSCSALQGGGPRGFLFSLPKSP